MHLVSRKNIDTSYVDTQLINGIFTAIGYIKHTRNPIIRFFRFYKLYKKEFNKLKTIDLIHLNVLYPFGVLLLFFNKIPFVISEHWTGYLSERAKKISLFQKILSKQIAKKAAFICPVSINLQEAMIQIGLNGNYQPVPNVVNTNLFTVKKKKEQELSIIHISNMNDEHKNISGMLRAAKHLENVIPNFTWKFIGGEAAPYHQLITSLNFKSATIKFINHLPQIRLVNELQKSHVLVLNSRFENLPCVILEAFSCGIPVITTNVGGIAEYFPNNFGKFIKLNDDSDLAKRIVEVKNSKFADAEEMHVYAEKHFGIRSIANQFDSVYLNALKLTQ